MKMMGILALAFGVAFLALPIFPADPALASEEEAAEAAGAEFEDREFENAELGNRIAIERPFEEANVPEVEAPRFGFEAPPIRVDRARPGAEDRLRAAGERVIERPDADVVPRLPVDRVRPDNAVRMADVREEEERAANRVFPREREFPVRERRLLNRFPEFEFEEPEIEIEFDPLIENIFLFNTVVTNAVLARPLFGLFADTRTWTIGQAITELKVTGAFRADLFDVRVNGEIALGHFVGADVFCRDGAMAHQTSLFPVDELGQVRIRDFVFLPAGCTSPVVVLVNEEGTIIAAAGLGFLGPTADFG